MSSMAEELDLVGTQRWMQAAILDPEGVSPGAGRVLTASCRLSAEQRLAIYHRGYRLRLLESLRELHPALCRLLGRELFEWFALDYLNVYPSRACTLFELDNRFADHLSRTRPDRDLPAEAREGWVDLIIDLTQFERTFIEVLDGPGTENGPAVCLADLPEAPDDAWLAATLVTVPCLRLLHTRFPVHDYVQGVRRGQDMAVPGPRPTLLAVSRRDYVVVVNELEPAAYRVLQALARGESLGAASHGVGMTEGWILLREWVYRRFFTAVDRGPVVGAGQPAGVLTASRAER
jgi:hypothetical protein